MNEIRCPNCGMVVPIDDLTYANVVKQIRDSEFERELASRQSLAVQAAVSEARLAWEKQTQALELQVRELMVDKTRIDSDARIRLDLELAQVRSEYEAELRGKDAEIAFYRDFKARQSTNAVGESVEIGRASCRERV